MINLIEPKTEIEVQIAVIEWFKLLYPQYIIKGNYLNGQTLRGKNGQVPWKKLKELKDSSGDNKNFPDLEILVVRPPYSGLFIELKKYNTTAFRKDGSFSNSKEGKRAIEQYAFGRVLELKGYAWSFGIGLEHSKKIIKAYMENNFTPSKSETF